MVPRDDDDILNAFALMEFHEKIVVLPCGLVGRSMAVENIARNKQRVDILMPDYADEMAQKCGGVVGASPPFHLRAKMPVGCVEEQHLFNA